MTFPVGDRFSPTPLEIASGMVLGRASAGFDPVGDLAVDLGDLGGVGGVDREARGTVTAIEAAVLPLLARSPCLISFSGGMDSSFVLAVALRAARRHGLPAPVPVIWRFGPDATAADETARQDEVLRALGAPDRIILRAQDELDFLGPIAGAVLARAGVRHPANLYVHAPVIAAAAGGSVLTGFGGDQVLGGHGRPSRGLWSSAVRRGLGVLPRAAQIELRRRRVLPQRPWLPADLRRRLGREQAASALARPADPWGRIRFRCDDRATEIAVGSLRVLAADHDVLIGHPFLHPGVQRPIADAALRTPLPRADLLRLLAGEELPDVVTTRHPKARFHQVFLRTASRQFRAGWSGEGADPALVDVVALRAFWAQEPMSTASAMLDQQWALSSGFSPCPSPRTHRPGEDPALSAFSGRGSALGGDRGHGQSDGGGRRVGAGRRRLRTHHPGLRRPAQRDARPVDEPHRTDG